MNFERYHYKTYEELKSEIQRLSVDIPLSENTGILKNELPEPHIKNRIAIQPMEGCDGTPDGKTVVDYATEALERHGLQKDGALLRAAGVTVYPAAYFCPMDYDTGALHITDETRSIHHYCASWHNEAQQYALELKRKMARFLPRRPAAVLATAVAKTKFEGFGACMRWVFKRR